MKSLRHRFPQASFLEEKGEVYLDSASTTLKLDFVIEILNRIYKEEVASVHRGTHHLSLKATEDYEQSRETIAQFLNAQNPEEIVFTRSTTEGLNFLASGLKDVLKEGDEILVSEMEHHSNFVPWQRLAKEKGCQFKVISTTPEGLLDLKSFKEQLTERTKILSMVHLSNVLSAINPIEFCIKKAKEKGTITIIDAAQSVSSIGIDVQKLNCDFLVFSGHKLFAPSGIGVLYGRKNELSRFAPYQSGGGMIHDVSLEDTEFAGIPQRFEAGTPFIEGAIALARVCSFVRQELDLNEILEFERSLVKEAILELQSIPGFLPFSKEEHCGNILAFIIEGIHPADISYIMTEEKVAIRSGHHCAIPLMKRFGREEGGLLRASFSVYNQPSDIQKLKQALKKSCTILRG